MLPAGLLVPVGARRRTSRHAPLWNSLGLGRIRLQGSSAAVEMSTASEGLGLPWLSLHRISSFARGIRELPVVLVVFFVLLGEVERRHHSPPSGLSMLNGLVLFLEV